MHPVANKQINATRVGPMSSVALQSRGKSRIIVSLFTITTAPTYTVPAYRHHVIALDIDAHGDWETRDKLRWARRGGNEVSARVLTKLYVQHSRGSTVEVMLEVKLVRVI